MKLLRVQSAGLAPALAAVLACSATSGEHTATPARSVGPKAASTRVEGPPRRGTEGASTTPERRIPAGGPTTPPPATLYLGAWLTEHGAPAASKEVVENEHTACERALHVGRPAQEAIQCAVIINAKGHHETDGHECETPECIHPFMVRTRVFVQRDSKLRIVLDVPSAVQLSSDGGLTQYIWASVAVAEDGLLAKVKLDLSCDAARDGVREDSKESPSVGSANWRFIAAATDQVCAAQGIYTWSGGQFRR